MIKEAYLALRVGPRLGLQLGAHPFFLPYGPTSSACPGLLGPPLKFNFLGGVGPSSLHYFLALVFPLPVMVGRVGSGMLGRQRSRKPGLG